MTIVRAQGPTTGPSIIGRAMTHLMTRGPGALPATGGAGATRATQPMQLFGLNLNDITDENFLQKAIPLGWRYLITNTSAIAVADVRETGSGPPRFGSLIRGMIAERLEQAAELAHQNYAAGPLTFEARILEITALYITALWLHGPRDILIPFYEGARENTQPVREDGNFISRVFQAAARKRQSA
jgi:hypothetical protein